MPYVRYIPTSNNWGYDEDVARVTDPPGHTLVDCGDGGTGKTSEIVEGYGTESPRREVKRLVQEKSSLKLGLVDK